MLSKESRRFVEPEKAPILNNKLQRLPPTTPVLDEEDKEKFNEI
jgi:hypothetical protein